MYLSGYAREVQPKFWGKVSAFYRKSHFNYRKSQKNNISLKDHFKCAKSKENQLELRPSAKLGRTFNLQIFSLRTRSEV